MLLAAGLSVAAVAWLALALWGGDRSMRLGVLTGGPALMSPAAMGSPAFMSMDSMTGMDMGGGGTRMSMLGVTVPGDAGDLSGPMFASFMWMWLVMIAAMMLPVLLPMARYRASGPGPAGAALAGGLRFTVADLAVWTAAGVPAYALLVAFQAWVPQPSSRAIRLAAVVVLVAGAYGFTAVKARARGACCMVPAGEAAVCAFHPGADSGEPWSAGLRHGVWSLACCGPLMLALLMVGMMNLVWMAILTVVMLLERRRLWGAWVSHAASAALVLTGVALLVYPVHLPALA